MDRKWTSAAIVAVGLLGAILAGCDYNGINSPPAETRTPEGPIKSMAVPAEAELHQAVLDAESARANYKYRLDVLQGYYNRIGYADKYNDTVKEMKNLQTAQWFRWEGLEEVQPAAGESVASADETALIEALIGARNAWVDALSRLENLYREKNLFDQANTIKRVKERLDPVRLPPYHLAAEVPPPTLRPTAVIPEANELFNRAHKLFIDGKGTIPGITTNYKKEREAVELFKDLVRTYKTSDKIALAAYYIGEIYKEYFNENVRAVMWYQRAWEWSENSLTEPAYFQCATVYDQRLADWNNAVMCYRGCLKYDPPRPLNFEYARQRIKDLTGKDE